MIKSRSSIRSWRSMALAVVAGAYVLFASPQAHAVLEIYLQDSSGRIGWVNASLPPGSPDQTPAGVFITTGNMADIAFGTNNFLWGISNESAGAVLYKMNVFDGTGATQGASAQTYWNTTASVTGLSVTYGGATNNAINYNALTFAPANSGAGSGKLYAATISSGGSPSSATSTLYSIDTTTGAATVIGTFGAGIISSGDLAFANWNGSSPGTLYANVNVGNSSVSQLASINLATGAATVIGAYTGANGAFQGLANSATNNGGLFSIDSQYVYSVNTSTGAGTQLFKYTAGQVTSVRGAAAFGEAIPAPAALGIFGLGLAGLALVRRR